MPCLSNKQSKAGIKVHAVHKCCLSETAEWLKTHDSTALQMFLTTHQSGVPFRPGCLTESVDCRCLLAGCLGLFVMAASPQETCQFLRARRGGRTELGRTVLCVLQVLTAGQYVRMGMRAITEKQRVLDKRGGGHVRRGEILASGGFTIGLCILPLFFSFSPLFLSPLFFFFFSFLYRHSYSYIPYYSTVLVGRNMRGFMVS